jgi:phosphohistidine phosphatase SixA
MSRVLIAVISSGLASSLLLSSMAFAADIPIWQAVADGGHAVLMRHALAPGTGDPPEFRLGDCATQRNLDAAGRAQARAIGQRFRDQGIDAARVRSSQWCRCLETARLLGLGEVVPTPTLNSFFRDRSLKAGRTAGALALIAAEADGENPNGPLVLVTHQVNITALTGVFPASGEMIVVRPTVDGVEVVGRIR